MKNLRLDFFRVFKITVLISICILAYLSTLIKSPYVIVSTINSGEETSISPILSDDVILTYNIKVNNYLHAPTSIQPVYICFYFRTATYLDRSAEGGVSVTIREGSRVIVTEQIKFSDMIDGGLSKVCSYQSVNHSVDYTGLTVVIRGEDGGNTAYSFFESISNDHDKPIVQMKFQIHEFWLNPFLFFKICIIVLFFTVIILIAERFFWPKCKPSNPAL